MRKALSNQSSRPGSPGEILTIESRRGTISLYARADEGMMDEEAR